MPKAYPDIKTTKYGFLGWVRMISQFKWIFVVLHMTILLASFGASLTQPIHTVIANKELLVAALNNWYPYALVALGVIAFIQFVIWLINKKTKQKDLLENHWGDMVLPSEGRNKDRVEGTGARKTKSAFIMMTTLITKLIFNAYIFQWIAPGLQVLAESNWLVSWGGWALVAVPALFMLIVMLLDIFAYFYIVEGFLGYVLAKWEGVNRIKSWNRSAAGTALRNISIMTVIGLVIFIQPLDLSFGQWIIQNPVYNIAGFVVGGAVLLTVANIILKSFGISQIGGDTVSEMFEKAGKKFEENILPPSYVNRAGVRQILTGEQRKVAWAKAWNMIVRQYLLDDLISIEEAKMMIFVLGISGKDVSVDKDTSKLSEDELNSLAGIGPDKYDFLNGKIKRSPDLRNIKPRNKQVQSRIKFFLSTLFMDIDQTPVWERMYMLTTAMPQFEEVIMYPFSQYTVGEYDGLNSKYKTGHTFLTYFMNKHSLEWDNFRARLTREIEQEKDFIKKAKKKADLILLNNLKPGEKLGNYNPATLDYEMNSMDIQQEVRLWLSFRYQPLARSIRGMMNNRQMYVFLAKVNFPTTGSFINNKNEIESKIAKYKTQSYEQNIDEIVDAKYEFLPGLQIYGESKEAVVKNTEEGKSKYRFYKNYLIFNDANYLLKKYKHFKAAYLMIGKNKSGGVVRYAEEKPENKEDIFYEFSAEEGGGYIVRDSYMPLSSHPFSLQGKPMNQSNILRFARGEIVQMMDMNQDMYLEETFKAPSLMEEFRKQSRLAIVGYPEDIFTGVSSPAGAVHAYGDHTFSTLIQRVLDFAGVRYHYGHPDFVRAMSFKQLGLLSQPWVNEDIFGAYKGTLYGEKVINREIMQAAKGREGVYAGLLGISDKFGAGAGEQSVSFEISLHNTSSVIGFSRQFIHFVASIGYFIRKPLVVLQNNLYILTVVLFGISFFAAFPDELIFGLIGLLLSQAITATGYFQLVIENGFLRGTLKFMNVFPKAAVIYQSLVYNAFSTGFQKAMVNNGDYIKTGRRPGRDHVHPFMDTKGIEDQGQQDLYFFLNKANFPKVVYATILAIVGLFLWRSWGSIWSIFPVLMVFASLMAPVLINPGSTPVTISTKRWWKQHKRDGKKFVEKLGKNRIILISVAFASVFFIAGGIPFKLIFAFVGLYWIYNVSREAFGKKFKGSKMHKYAEDLNGSTSLSFAGIATMFIMTILGIILTPVDLVIQLATRIFSGTTWAKNVRAKRMDNNGDTKDDLREREVAADINAIRRGFAKKNLEHYINSDNISVLLELQGAVKGLDVYFPGDKEFVAPNKQAKSDPTRSLPGTTMPTKAEVNKHDISRFEEFDESSEEVKRTEQALRANGYAEMADHLVWMAKAGLVRGGPLVGFLATTIVIPAQAGISAKEYVLISTNYPTYNTLTERVLSLAHEIGATSKFNLSHEDNTIREEAISKWLVLNKTIKASKYYEKAKDVLQISIGVLVLVVGVAVGAIGTVGFLALLGLGGFVYLSKKIFRPLVGDITFIRGWRKFKSQAASYFNKELDVKTRYDWLSFLATIAIVLAIDYLLHFGISIEGPINQDSLLETVLAWWNPLRILTFWILFLGAFVYKMPFAIFYGIFNLSTFYIFPESFAAGTFMRNYGYNLFFDVIHFSTVLLVGYETYSIVQDDLKQTGFYKEKLGPDFLYSFKKISIFAMFALAFLTLVEIAKPAIEPIHKMFVSREAADFSRELTVDIGNILAYMGGTVLSVIVLNIYYPIFKAVDPVVTRTIKPIHRFALKKIYGKEYDTVMIQNYWRKSYEDDEEKIGKGEGYKVGDTVEIDIKSGVMSRVVEDDKVKEDAPNSYPAPFRPTDSAQKRYKGTSFKLLAERTAQKNLSFKLIEGSLSEEQEAIIRQMFNKILWLSRAPPEYKFHIVFTSDFKETQNSLAAYHYSDKILYIHLFVVDKLVSLSQPDRIKFLVFLKKVVLKNHEIHHIKGEDEQKAQKLTIDYFLEDLDAAANTFNLVKERAIFELRFSRSFLKLILEHKSLYRVLSVQRASFKSVIVNFNVPEVFSVTKTKPTKVILSLNSVFLPVFLTISSDSTFPLLVKMGDNLVFVIVAAAALLTIGYLISYFVYRKNKSSSNIENSDDTKDSHFVVGPLLLADYSDGAVEASEISTKQRTDRIIERVQEGAESFKATGNISDVATLTSLHKQFYETQDQRVIASLINKKVIINTYKGRLVDRKSYARFAEDDLIRLVLDKQSKVKEHLFVKDFSGYKKGNGVSFDCIVRKYDDRERISYVASEDMGKFVEDEKVVEILTKKKYGANRVFVEKGLLKRLLTRKSLVLGISSETGNIVYLDSRYVNSNPYRIFRQNWHINNILKYFENDKSDHYKQRLKDAFTVARTFYEKGSNTGIKKKKSKIVVKPLFKNMDEVIEFLYVIINTFGTQYSADFFISGILLGLSQDYLGAFSKDNILNTIRASQSALAQNFDTDVMKSDNRYVDKYMKMIIKQFDENLNALQLTVLYKYYEFINNENEDFDLYNDEIILIWVNIAEAINWKTIVKAIKDFVGTTDNEDIIKVKSEYNKAIGMAVKELKQLMINIKNELQARINEKGIKAEVKIDEKDYLGMAREIYFSDSRKGSDKKYEHVWDLDDLARMRIVTDSDADNLHLEYDALAIVLDFMKSKGIKFIGNEDALIYKRKYGFESNDTIYQLNKLLRLEVQIMSKDSENEADHGKIGRVSYELGVRGQKTEDPVFLPNISKDESSENLLKNLKEYVKAHDIINNIYV
ncbi:MAG: hypothetical protein P9X22_09345 [Candidatus Zapsychrus exili]|nr:hypothetical protein [Candidatus Zapsychrus exili]